MKLRERTQRHGKFQTSQYSMFANSVSTLFRCSSNILMKSVKREKKPTRCNNQVFIVNFCINIIMPIFRRTKTVLLHLVYCSGSAGCGWQRLCAAPLQDAGTACILQRCGDRIPMGGEIFRAVQIGLETHPASCKMGYGYFHVLNWAMRAIDHPPLSSAGMLIFCSQSCSSQSVIRKRASPLIQRNELSAILAALLEGIVSVHV